MLKREIGLTEEEVIDSRKKFGTNSLVKIKRKTIIRRFFENLSDPIIKILLAALALEIIFTFGNCNFVEIGGIVIAILIATTVSTVSEYSSEKAFDKIEADSKDSKIRVIRDFREVEINGEDLVVGDIVRLIRGERIQADGRIISGEIFVDQSALNGENAEVRKYPSNEAADKLSSNCGLFSGSIITDGEGVMKVEKVGVATFYGMVATEVQSEGRISPLKLRLTKLASQISKLGYIAAVLVGITYLFNTFVTDMGFVPWRILDGLKDTKFLLSNLLHALTLMITVVVVAVPEGLPMMITVVLSANMKRMIRDNVLVKRLVGIETAGSLNILFTDKTGTLTTGRLAVDRIISSEKIYKNVSNLRASGKIYSELLINARLNTDCALTPSGILGGNATDRAIAEFFADEKLGTVRVKDKISFKSELKYSSVTLDNGTNLIKGAPEVIISHCRFCISENGEVYSSDMSFIRNEYSKAVSAGERVIAVAETKPDSDAMIFVGLIVLKDKIRKGVKEAVKDVLSAGIQIVMVTGDNKETAVNIATESGFFNKNAGHIAITSEEMAMMSDDDLKAILPNLRVVSRALPKDKSRLVKIACAMDLVVGMTGDGINDAPSLKLADVGFAMGSGTDIAKSAGDIVILDDSFESISKTVLYGRTIFESIRKFITFQLIMNFAACGITLIGQYLGIDNPITIIQMLWVNIIMDTLGGLAFAGEPPIRRYMAEKPKRRDEPILSRSMIGHILLNGIFTLALLILFLCAPYFKQFYGTLARHLTAFYALFIFAGLANCFTARSDRLFIFSGILKNKLFLIIMLFITAIQGVIVYFGGSWFRSTPLSPKELGLTVLLSLTVLVFDTFRRIFAKLK